MKIFECLNSVCVRKCVFTMRKTILQQCTWTWSTSLIILHYIKHSTSTFGYLPIAVHDYEYDIGSFPHFSSNSFVLLMLKRGKSYFPYVCDLTCLCLHAFVVSLPPAVWRTRVLFLIVRRCSFMFAYMNKVALLDKPAARRHRQRYGLWGGTLTQVTTVGVCVRWTKKASLPSFLAGMIVAKKARIFCFFCSYNNNQQTNISPLRQVQP